MRSLSVGVLLFALGCGASGPPAAAPGAETKAKSAAGKAKQERELPPLDAAEAAYARSDYALAETKFRAAMAEPATEARARLGLARVQLITGRYEAASAALPELDTGLQTDHALVRATALARLGKLQVGGELLAAIGGAASAEIRLLQGELLLEQGRRDEAEAVLMTIIGDYNEDRIAEDDARLLAVVGRAAQLLRSPADANEAFNQAELAGAEDDRTLFWRVELFFDNYDLGHAEEVVSELLARSPKHPDALVWMAHVSLEQALDFEAAERLVRRALEVNPRHARAHFVLAGLALRNLGIERALEHAEQGLRTNPRDLELLSIAATAHFLADDPANFERVKRQVFAHNPGFTRFHQIVGTYADWEHRYEEIVAMMREAVAIDEDDAKAHAQLGLNLIRNGDDQGGVRSLRTAFAKDPYNVRVYNTLGLYEKTIPEAYVDVSADPFRFRYPAAERAVLDRHVPPLLKAAWGKFERYYEFTPSVPIGVELYAERPNFAIRTSGLPRTAIQGVCFGKTLASMSPRHEQFNVGMTLWHELAHVFHIQLSRSRVPRWFTEGLAEYETLIERKEWRREQDQGLYLAFAEQRLPKLGNMNEAFTHAEDISDVAVAYYASTQIVQMLAERYGRPSLRKMLVAWGEGKRTEQVFTSVLGKTSVELDAEFRQHLKGMLAPYEQQFVPSQRIGDPEQVVERAEKQPEDADAQVRLALLLSRNGKPDQARVVLKSVLEKAPSHALANWVSARIALAAGDEKGAGEFAKKLVEVGKDGYETRIILARSAAAADDRATAQSALQRAHEFDPKQAEPLHGLLDLTQGDQGKRLSLLERLAAIDEHDGSVYQRLSAALRMAGRIPEAIVAAESAVYAAMEDPRSHLALAEALAAAADHERAVFAFDSALACPDDGVAKADAHLAYARYLQSRGQAAKAKEQLERAHQKNPKLRGEAL